MNLAFRLHKHLEKQAINANMIHTYHLQIKHFPVAVLVHQLTYTKKILKLFYMDKLHRLSSPMVVCSLDVKNDPFRPCEKC